jgi:hypothetical protein
MNFHPAHEEKKNGLVGCTGCTQTMKKTKNGLDASSSWRNENKMHIQPISFTSAGYQQLLTTILGSSM